MYAKVFRSLWDGTLAESWEGWSLLVFLMAHADPDGFVDMTPASIARRSGIPLEAVERALELLEQPDPMSRSAAEDGRRLVRVNPGRPWGWRIVNYRSYRGVVDAETQREQARERQRARRGRMSREVTQGHGQSPQAEAEAEAAAEGTEEPRVDGSAGAAGSPTLGLEVGTQVSREVVESAASDPRASRRDVEVRRATLEVDAAVDAVVELPTNRPGVSYPVGRMMVDEWVALYPAVDVLAELRKMRGWLLADPPRRKTWRGMPAFVNRWLASEQDRGNPRRSGSRSGSDRRYVDANSRGEQ